jgi:hypothetical protein
VVGKIFKWLFVLAFIGAIGVGIYLVAQQLLYRGEVKVAVLKRGSAEPIAGKEVIFERICSATEECVTEEMFRKTTSSAGIFYVNSKQLNSSFNVVASGFAVDGPWQKRPGSLLFTRQYAVGDVYQADVTEDDLIITLLPE